jgi:hypothetical protein
MEKAKVFIIICLSLSLINPVSSYSGDGWKLVINKNGISVFTRPAQDSKVDEFKAITTIKSELEVLGEVMKDIPAQPQWIADCSHARVVKRIDNSTLLIYSVYKTPWPVTDRDTVIKTVTRMDPKKRWFTIHMESASSHPVPVKSNRVRIRKLKGRWTFRKSGNGSVIVTYNLSVDPGGSLPLWLANRTSRKSPYTTLANLRKMVTLSKYHK